MQVVQRSVSVLLAVLLMCGIASAEVPPLGEKELARGPYSTMRALIQRTIFRVDIVTMEIRFGPRDRDRLAALARGRSYSDELGAQLARTAAEAEHALVQVQFHRNVSFDAWLEDAQKNLRLARDAEYIDEESFRRVYHELPQRFAAVQERGFRKGDRIVYRVRPTSLRAVLVTADDRVLLHQLDRGQLPGRILLAGFFAPGIEPRGLLLRSLFDD